MGNQLESGTITTVMSGSNSVKKMERKIIETKQKHGKSCAVWIAIDIDNRSDSQLSEIFKLARSSVNVHVALSNPCFELWLLLHFNDGRDVRDSRDLKTANSMCLQNLKNVEGWNDYAKSVKDYIITRHDILTAAKRAKSYDATATKS